MNTKKLEVAPGVQLTRFQLGLICLSGIGGVVLGVLICTRLLTEEFPRGGLVIAKRPVRQVRA